MDPLSTYLPKDLLNEVYEYSNPFLEAHKKKMRRICKTFVILYDYKLHIIFRKILSEGKDPRRFEMKEQLENYILTPTQCRFVNKSWKCESFKKMVIKSFNKYINYFTD